MYYGNIKKTDIADGPGVRVSLFVSGCTHHCKGCFQPETWDFEYGLPYTKRTQEEILTALSPSYIAGLTLLGGEPFEPENQRELTVLLRRVREEFPQKNVWCYTGYKYEELTENRDILKGYAAQDTSDVTEDPLCPDKASPENTFKQSPVCEVTSEMISLIDVLVDGEFVEGQKNIMLKFRGSENQRLIDLRKTISSGSIVLWE